MRKLSLTLLITLLIALLFSLFVAKPALADKSYYAERFDVQIDIQENGSALITETVEFRFSGDPFTFAFREISAAETDGLTFLDASMDGVAMPFGTGAGQVEVEAGNPLKVTWHFSPTSDAAHVFTVRYRADGIIRKGEADTLIWRAVPEDHDYSIAKSTITLTYPTKATLLGQPTLNWDFDAAWQDDRLILTRSGLGTDEDLIITANFAPNSLTQTAPQWQVRAEQRSAATATALPVGFIAGIATLVLGGLGLFTYVRANGRDLTINPVISTAYPPSEVPPAVVGKLTGMYTYMGTIFDLAQRGVLEVVEEKGFWGSKSFVLTRKDINTALLPHEQGLLEALFKDGETEVNMNEVGARVASKNDLFDKPLENELVQRGWFDPERKKKRTQLIIAGVLVLCLVCAVLVATLLLGTQQSTDVNAATLFAVIIGVSLGAFLLSIALMIYGGYFSVLTPAGEEQAARWKGFAEYLKQVSKGKEPAIRPDTFEKYLAYAAVFGLGTHWAKYFQDLGGVPLPIWFHATAGSHADFGSMVAVMSASDSSSAGGGAGGGGGASGGGSSGAG